MMLQGSELPQHLPYVSSYGVCNDLHRLDHSCWIDQEPAPLINPLLRVVNSIKCSDQASPVGEHGKESAALYHLREFFFLPAPVGVHAVHAKGQNFRPQFAERRVLDGNCRQFRRSNRAEISGIEEKHDPTASVLKEAHFPHCTAIEGVSGELRSFLSHSDTHARPLFATVNVISKVTRLSTSRFKIPPTPITKGGRGGICR